MLESRAALKLGRLRQAQNKPNQAREVLLAAYSKMTEGFTTFDLKQAQTFLVQLDQSVSSNSI